MRPHALLGLVPFVAAAAVGLALREAGPAPHRREAVAALLRDAAARLMATGPGARAYVADVVYERRWDGGEVAVELRVAVAPEREIRVEFRGVRGRHGERAFGGEAAALRGLAMRAPGLRRMLHLVRDPELAARNYRVEDLGPTLVGERPATRLRLVPRHGPGRSLELVLDQATGIPLERRERSDEGHDLGAWRVTALELDPAPSAPEAPAFELPSALADTGDADLRPAAAVMQLHEPAWLPAGFAEVDRRRHDTEAGPIVQAEYTDGIARLAIVQWPAGAPVFAARARAAAAQVPEVWRQAFGKAWGGRRRGDGERGGRGGEGEGRPDWKGYKQGPGHGHGWGARVTIGGTEVRVIGDADKDTLQKIAEHLRPVTRGEP